MNPSLRSKILFVPLLFILELSACAAPNSLPAGVPPKVAFSTMVRTAPEPLRCNVQGKSGIAMTITTPALVPIFKFGPPITIRCFAKGYWTTRLTVLAGSKKPLLTRTLNGEKITPAYAPIRGKDVGPGGEFPREVLVIMRRDTFNSAAERDAYYAEQLNLVERNWVTLVEQGQAECDSGAVSQKGRTAVTLPSVCREGLRRLKAMKGSELQLVEQQRRRSRIP